MSPSAYFLKLLLRVDLDQTRFGPNTKCVMSSWWRSGLRSRIYGSIVELLNVTVVAVVSPLPPLPPALRSATLGSWRMLTLGAEYVDSWALSAEQLQRSGQRVEVKHDDDDAAAAAEEVQEEKNKTEQEDMCPREVGGQVWRSVDCLTDDNSFQMEVLESPGEDGVHHHHLHPRHQFIWRHETLNR